VQSKVTKFIRKFYYKIKIFIYRISLKNLGVIQDFFQKWRRGTDWTIVESRARGAIFFLPQSPAERELIITRFKEQFSDQVELITKVAEQTRDHRFNLLGTLHIHPKSGIEWHLDTIYNYRFNSKFFFADIKPASYPGGYEIKVPWELSRFQHLIWLGQAYWFTGNELYAREFVSQVCDWIAHNPYPYGVNWTCPMDVSIRVVNWLWGYYFLKDSITLTDEFRQLMFESIWVHGKHIWHNLENIGSTNNHYLANLVGLIYIGLLCQELKETKQWREFGLRELEREMFKQVYPDGVNFEASTSYHRLATEMFLSATILASLYGYSFSSAYMKRLEKMLEFIMDLSKPDGTVPLIGDHDNGRLHRLKVWMPPEREWLDFRYLLAIGAVLFERQDFAIAAADQWEEALWLLGVRVFEYLSKSISSNKVSICSKAYADGGIYIMRHKDNQVIIRTGMAQDGNSGHAHNDSLSFEYFTQGVSWIVDPGCYLYTADYNERNRFRSTSYHNTVVVNGEEQSEFNPRNAFSPLGKKEVKVLTWQENDDFILFVGEHDGYARNEYGVIHRRKVILYKEPDEFLWITDELLGKGKCKFESFLHLGEARIQSVEGDRVCLESLSDSKKILYLQKVNGASLSWKIVDTWRSLGYGHKQKNHSICLVGEENLPCSYSLAVHPYHRDKNYYIADLTKQIRC